MTNSKRGRTPPSLAPDALVKIAVRRKPTKKRLEQLGVIVLPPTGRALILRVNGVGPTEWGEQDGCQNSDLAEE